MITTQEKITVEGKEYSKFYTTRKAIVQKLTGTELMDAVNNDDKAFLGPVKITQGKTKKGRNVFLLEDA